MSVGFLPMVDVGKRLTKTLPNTNEPCVNLVSATTHQVVVEKKKRPEGAP
jgi:hypothetical protein